MTEPGDARRTVAARRAAELATAEGLDGLSLGQLASDLEMSKSGLAGLFGSKEGLQVAAIDHMAGLFRDQVLSVGGERGVDHLRRLLAAWFDYVATYPDGCFFQATGPEGAQRDGAVGAAMAEVLDEIRDHLHEEVRLAQRLGELDPGASPIQISFELHALVSEANFVHRVYHDPKAGERAMIAADRVLSSYAA